MLCRAFAPFDLIQQHLHSSSAKLITGLVDRGERRIHEFRDIEVVEAHHGNILRAAQAQLANGQ